MRARSVIFLAVVAIAAVLALGASGEQAEKKQFKFACILFDRKENQAVFQGHMNTHQFRKWFREDYAVAGERFETPKEATAFGALVLTDGDEILVMPLYTWGNRKQKYYACQSHTIGAAPMFRVLEKSKKRFLDKMKAELGKLQKAEPKDALDKK